LSGVPIVFVAGAAGVIGKPLVTLLVQGGHRVFGTTRSKTRAANLERSGVSPIVLDVFDRQAVADAIKGPCPDVVIERGVPGVYNVAEPSPALAITRPAESWGGILAFAPDNREPVALRRDCLRVSSAALVVSYGPLNFGTVSAHGRFVRGSRTRSRGSDAAVEDASSLPGPSRKWERFLDAYLLGEPPALSRKGSVPLWRCLNDEPDDGGCRKLLRLWVGAAAPTRRPAG